MLIFLPSFSYILFTSRDQPAEWHAPILPYKIINSTSFIAYVTENDLREVQQKQYTLKPEKIGLQSAFLLSFRKPFATNFTPNFIINNENVCSDSVDVVACVHSAPEHSQLRDIVRRTWANQRFWPNLRIRTMFFVGTSQVNHSIQELLVAEEKEHNDIVQVNFVDTYRNLTLKAVSVLHWLRAYCPHSKYYMKVDDDVIVNIFTLQEQFMNVTSNYSTKHGELICLHLRKNKVERKHNIKHAVTRKELATRYFPPFCAGMGYMMLTSTALALNDAISLEPLFWIDDVYVTGFLSRRIKATFRSIGATYNDTLSIAAFTSKLWKNFGFGHMKNISLIEDVWNHLYLKAEQEHTVLQSK